MNIFDLDLFLKDKFKKTPKLKKDFERLILLYFFGDFNSFDEIYNYIDNEELNDIDIDINSIINHEIKEIDINYIDNLLKKFFNNRNLFKNIGLYLDGFYGKFGNNHQFSTLEEFDDYMNEEIEKSKIIKYQNSFLKSYKNLANDETFLIFKEIFEKKINREVINKSISKIKVLNTKDLNLQLKSLINSERLEPYIKKITDENLNFNLISTKNNILIIDIKDYNTSNFIGSKQWCISYDEKYWNDYKNKKTNKNIVLDLFANQIKKNDNNIYFVIDFNKDITESEYMIAITTLPSGEFIFANDKNDKDILNNLKNKDFFQEEIYKYSKNNENYFLDLNDVDFSKSNIHGKLNYIKINSSNPFLDLINYIKNSKLDFSNYNTISYFLNNFFDLYMKKNDNNIDNKYFNDFLEILNNTGIGFNTELIFKIVNDKENDYSKYSSLIEDSIIYEINEGNIKLTDKVLFFVAKFNINGSFVCDGIINLINDRNDEELILFLNKNKNEILKDEFFNNLIFNISYFDNNKSKIIFDYFEENLEKIYFNINNKKSIQYLLNISDSVFFQNNNINKYPKIKENIINKIDYESCYFFKKNMKEYKEEKSIINKINKLINLKIIDEKKLNILFDNLLNDKNFNFNESDKKDLNCLNENKESLILLLKNKYIKNNKNRNSNKI